MRTQLPLGDAAPVDFCPQPLTLFVQHGVLVRPATLNSNGGTTCCGRTFGLR